MKAGTRRAAPDLVSAPVSRRRARHAPRPVIVWRRLRCRRSFTPGCGSPAACGGSVRDEPPGASSRGYDPAGFCADALRTSAPRGCGGRPRQPRFAAPPSLVVGKHWRSRSVTSLSHRVRTFGPDWPSCGTMRHCTSVQARSDWETSILAFLRRKRLLVRCSLCGASARILRIEARESTLSWSSPLVGEDQFLNRRLLAGD